MIYVTGPGFKVPAGTVAKCSTFAVVKKYASFQKKMIGQIVFGGYNWIIEPQRR